VYQILSESTGLCRRYEKTFLCVLYRFIVYNVLNVIAAVGSQKLLRD